MSVSRVLILSSIASGLVLTAPCAHAAKSSRHAPRVVVPKPAAKRSRRVPKPTVKNPRVRNWSFGFSTRPKLGLSVQSLSKELRIHFGAKPNRGVLVAKIAAGSPAAKAGVKVGDVLVSVNGQDVRSAFDVTKALKNQSGRTVRTVVVRNRKARVLLAKLPKPKPAKRSGPGKTSGKTFKFHWGPSSGPGLKPFKLEEDGWKLEYDGKRFRFEYDSEKKGAPPKRAPKSKTKS